MDFTPPPNPIQPQPISSFPPSASAKLPIKRKTPSPSSNLILTAPKLESLAGDDNVLHDATARPPPFKFHRIWTELDEIRFLQGLLDCSSQGLSFPRDLGVFYARFSNGMSQPYSKSQLSEKLRRLRKKFRVISSRLAEGLDKAVLSPQDRALYDLSKQLWDPDRSPSSPIGVSNSNCKPISSHNCRSNLVGVNVGFSPMMPSPSMAVLALPSVIKKTSNYETSNKDNDLRSKAIFNGDVDVDVKLRGVNVELDHHVEVVRKEVKVKSVHGGSSSGVVHFTTRTLSDVLDQSLKEIRRVIDLQGYPNLEKEMSFEKRWSDQHAAEFEVFAKRLKLIVEHSSMVGK